MRSLKKLLGNQLLLFLLNSVMIELVFVVVVLNVFHGVPDVPPDSGLMEIIRVFED